MARQIHLNVDQKLWKRLYDATSEWPKKHRNEAGICRYALRELAYDLSYGDDPIDFDRMFPPGKKHLQVHARGDDAEIWAEAFEEVGGTYARMLSIALVRLHDSLTREIQEEETVA